MKEIIKEYSEKWSCKPCTIRTLLNETLIYINKNYQQDKENVRVLNQMRLDSLFGSAVTVKDKLKILDQMNKLYNLYDTNVNIGNKDDDIKFNIGVK